ncbi:MAG: putative signal transduction protein with EAL and GGDEF domain [Gammaproteobacteria bacterium]
MLVWTRQSLLKRADLALYEANEHRRGSHRFYSSAIHQKLQRARRIIDIIERHEPAEIFRLVYQSHQNLQTQRITATEALLRWTHAEFADATPPEIINLLERHRHMASVSEWILGKALAQLTRWDDAGADANFAMSVNMSADLLR